MSRFVWNGQAGDDAPDSAKKNWAAPLPPPPREVYQLIDAAERCGLWLKWARDPIALRRIGARYRLCRAGTETVVFMSDDLDEIADCLAEFA